jgi:hypothetical protein
MDVAARQCSRRPATHTNPHTNSCSLAFRYRFADTIMDVAARRTSSAVAVAQLPHQLIFTCVPLPLCCDAADTIIDVAARRTIAVQSPPCDTHKSPHQLMFTCIPLPLCCDAADTIMDVAARRTSSAVADLQHRNTHTNFISSCIPLPLCYFFTLQIQSWTSQRVAPAVQPPNCAAVAQLQQQLTSLHSTTALL